MGVVSRRTLTEATADALRSRILEGAWPAGAPLRQEALAAEFGVSRIPLREALQRLEAEGLVELHSHRGAVVSPLPIEEAAELFELRAQLEGDLARRAVPRLTSEDDRAISELADAFAATVRTGTLAEWGEANRRFHFALYQRASRPGTCDIVARLHTQCDRFLRLQLTLTQGTRRAIAEHRAIAAAAAARDSDRTEHLVREHILGAGRTLATEFARHRVQESA